MFTLKNWEYKNTRVSLLVELLIALNYNDKTVAA